MPNNTVLVVEMTADLKETYGGVDSVLLVDMNTKSETFQYGNVSVRRTFPVDFNDYSKSNGLTGLTRQMALSITLRRYIDAVSLAQWDNRRMTGFTLDWHYEDENGTKVDVEPERKFTTAADNTNVQFIRLVNILYNGLSFNNITVEEMWKNVKDYRLECGWIRRRTM